MSCRLPVCAAMVRLHGDKRCSYGHHGDDSRRSHLSAMWYNIACVRRLMLSLLRWVAAEPWASGGDK